jgi:cysteinyl-tRNA synthetase
LGVHYQSVEEWFQGNAKTGGPSADDIEALIVERREARVGKDFARADQIRDDLIAQGILLEDGPDGTTWRRSN